MLMDENRGGTEVFVDFVGGDAETDLLERSATQQRRERGGEQHLTARYHEPMISRASALAILLSLAICADTAAGVQWTIPPGWSAQPARQMRVATYTVPEDGECAVFFFGQGQGGAVDPNLQR